MGKLPLIASLSRSLCLSASLSHSPRWLETMAKGIVVRNTEREDYSLFPSTADVICVPLNCCILRGSNLKSHCVKHTPRLLRLSCWQALSTSLEKNITWCLFWVDWVLSTKYEESHHSPATPCLRLCFLVMYFFLKTALPMMRLLLPNKLITWFKLSFSLLLKLVPVSPALMFVIVSRNVLPQLTD